MFRRMICTVLLALALTVCLSGCGRGMRVLKEFAEIENGFLEEWKDNKDGIKQEFYELMGVLIEEINDWSESAAAGSVTGDDSLTGARKIRNKFHK